MLFVHTFVYFARVGFCHFPVLLVVLAMGCNYDILWTFLLTVLAHLSQTLIGELIV